MVFCSYTPRLHCMQCLRTSTALLTLFFSEYTPHFHCLQCLHTSVALLTLFFSIYTSLALLTMFSLMNAHLTGASILFSSMYILFFHGGAPHWCFHFCVMDIHLILSRRRTSLVLQFFCHGYTSYSFTDAHLKGASVLLSWTYILFFHGGAPH